MAERCCPYRVASWLLAALRIETELQWYSDSEKAMEPINPREKKHSAEECERIAEEQSANAFAEVGGAEIGEWRERNRKTAHKRVLLVTDDEEMDRGIFQYAMQLCARLGAGLEIVHLVESDLAAARENSWFDELRSSLEKKKIVYRAMVPRGSIEQQVARYARGRRDILCVVLAPVKKMDKARSKATGKSGYKFLKNFSCPVVLFEPEPSF